MHVRDLVVHRRIHGIPHLVLMGMLLLSAACAMTTSEMAVRAATDVPEQFLVGSLEGDGTTEPVAGAGCRNPMVDPRDGTKLRLLRAQEGQGDYDVPAGRYGAGPRDALRIECATGRPVGIVVR